MSGLGISAESYSFPERSQALRTKDDSEALLKEDDPEALLKVPGLSLALSVTPPVLRPGAENLLALRTLHVNDKWDLLGNYQRN